MNISKTYLFVESCSGRLHRFLSHFESRAQNNDDWCRCVELQPSKRALAFPYTLLAAEYFFKGQSRMTRRF